MMTHTPLNEPTRAGARGTSPPTATSSQETAPRRRRTSAELLRVLYDQLRELAHARMAREPSGGAGMTLQPTALVHEAYLRIAGDSTGASEKDWDSRGHFFAAAALAMRRILVERARYQKRLRHGGGRARVNIDDALTLAEPEGAGRTDLIALDEALTKLEQLDPRKAKVVALRYFAGLSVDETAAAMDLSAATVKNDWAFARAWLHREMNGESAG